MSTGPPLTKGGIKGGSTMIEIFNELSEKEKRRLLRNNSPKAETILWNQLRNRKILGERFLRQFSVGSYVVDFYCPKLRLVVEIDGISHSHPEEIEYDRVRQSDIEILGIEFLRFKNEEVYNKLRWVIKTIEDKVRELISNKFSISKPL